MWSSLGNEPLPAHPRWVPEPENRGTYGIFSSCFITLILCVWTCLHMNVPNEAHGPVFRAVLKAQWVFFGLISPEIMVFYAGNQWLEQRALAKDMQLAFRGCSPPPPSPWYIRMLQRVGWAAKEPGVSMRQYAWTSTHSFLAVMGGFVFDNGLDPDGFPFPHGRQRLTILPTGLCHLAYLAPDLVPDVSLAAIRDKSKADRLAQLVACIQALWFCIQMIARMAQHLPLTILELVTFAHAFSAIVVYVLWWNKPLDIEVPFLIPVQRNTRAAALCIRLCGNHAWTTRPPRPPDNDDPDHNTKASTGAGPKQPDDIEAAAAAAGPGQPDDGSRTNYYEMEPTPEAARKARATTTFDRNARAEDLPPPVVLYQHGPDGYLFDSYETRGHYEPVAGGPGFYTIQTTAVDYSRRNLLAKNMKERPYGGATVTGILYSGWHLTAWNGPFHGAATHALWFTAVVVPPATVLLMVVPAYIPRVRSLVMPKLLYDTIGFVGLVAIIVARGYLLVESLVGLAYVPDGAFQQPDWSPYFPHIGS